jgi:hypothetical protein
LPIWDREKGWIIYFNHYFSGRSDTSKSRENCGEVRVPKKFGQARPLKSQETVGKPRFENFLGPQKIVGHRGKIQILTPVHCGKNRTVFLDEPVLQNPKTLRKNPRFENFLGPLKIAGNRRKIRNFETCTSWENHKKVRILRPVPKISQLANPPIFSHFSSHSPPNNGRCSKPEAYCLLPLCGPK